MVAILVVEDSDARIKKITSMVEGIANYKVDIDVCKNTLEARGKLAERAYDLLILDICVPIRDEPNPDHRNSVALLIEIVEGGVFKRPRKIIGITAYDYAFNDAMPYFERYTWMLIREAVDSGAWLQSIRECIDYFGSGESQRISYETDICIVTALQDPEFRSVLRLPWNWKEPVPLDDSMYVSRGTFVSGGRNWSVAATVCSGMGSVRAALRASRAVNKLRPRFLVMTGICGGVSSEVDFCDVIVADLSWDSQSGKLKESEFLQEPYQFDIAPWLKERVDAFIEKNYADKKAGFSVKTAPVACSPFVVADEDHMEKVKGQQRKMAGIDMEIYGIYATSRHVSRPRPTAIAFKGVSDFADKDKDDSARVRASDNSAEVMRAFFESEYHDIHSFAGEI